MFDHQCYIHLVDLIEFSGFGFFGSNATVTSAMSLLERIFFWRPDALPLLGGIKASKHTTASSSSLLPFVHVRQCVTSGDSKNKQKMCFVAGEVEGGVPCWGPPPTIRTMLGPHGTPPPPSEAGSEVVLPLSILPIEALATSALSLSVSSLSRLHIQFPARPHHLPSPHIQSARPHAPAMMMHAFLLPLPTTSNALSHLFSKCIDLPLAAAAAHARPSPPACQ